MKLLEDVDIPGWDDVLVGSVVDNKVTALVARNVFVFLLFNSNMH